MNNPILSQNQINFLKIVGNENAISNNFYLTGGTALSAFYFKHRYSEDLDFFSENEIDILSIDVFLKKIKKDIGFKKIDFTQSFNRNIFFLHFSDEVLKTEFTFFPFPRIEKGKFQFGVLTDSLIDLAVNKLFTIYQRSVARDYIDLFYICSKKKFSMQHLINLAKVKFDWHIDPVQLGSQFLKSNEVKDMPRLIKHVSQDKLNIFYLNETKKLENKIFKK